MRFSSLLALIVWVSFVSIGCKRAEPNPPPPAPPVASPPPPAAAPPAAAPPITAPDVQVPPTTKVPPKAPPPIASGARACASTTECGDGQTCTTETGACDKPPGCGPNDMCAAVCYGRCVGGGKPAPSATCKTNGDCRLFSDYCTGCDCRVLAKGAPAPKCKGPGVRCIADPCMTKRAACMEGHCVAVDKAPDR